MTDYELCFLRLYVTLRSKLPSLQLLNCTKLRRFARDLSPGIFTEKGQIATNSLYIITTELEIYLGLLTL